MVSWRGVAKKRRKQGVGGRLTKCSFTVAVTQQSWRDGNHYSFGFIEPAPAAPSGCRFREPAPRPVTTSGRPIEKIPRCRFASPHRLGQTESAGASPRIAKRDLESQDAIRTASPQRMIVRSRLRAPKITTPDINRVRSRSRHFCAAGTFCTSFRHATTRPATCVQSAERSFIRKTKQRRAQFVAEVLIARGSGRCAEAQAA